MTWKGLVSLLWKRSASGRSQRVFTNLRRKDSCGLGSEMACSREAYSSLQLEQRPKVIRDAVGVDSTWNILYIAVKASSTLT
jgi:hypothetical protein